MLIKPAQEIIEKSRKRNLTFPVLRFPENIGTHAIVLVFKEYKYKGGGLQNNITEIPRGAITLPIPANLVETYDLRVQTSDLGLVGGMVAHNLAGITGSDSIARAGTEAAENVFGSILETNSEKLKSQAATASDIARFFIRGGLSTFGGNTPISAGLGTVINPHMAVTFEGMNMKHHSFNWKFAPRNETESNKLKMIQKEIKRSILPSYVQTEGIEGFLSKSLFNYPKVVDVFFVGLDQEYFYYFKRCMVRTMTSNYSPGSGHAFLKGGRPSIVDMTLELMETQIHTAEDYSDD